MRSAQPFLIVAALLACGDRGQPISAVVDYLVNSPHGAFSPSDEYTRHLERARRQPDAVVDEVARRFDRRPATDFSDHRLRNQFGAALQVLGMLHAKTADDFVARTFLRFDDAAADPALARVREESLSLRDTALAALRSRREEVVQHLVQRLGSLSFPERGRAFNYLLECCRGDAKLAATIQQMVDAPGSPLKDDHVTERSLEALRRDAR